MAEYPGSHPPESPRPPYCENFGKRLVKSPNLCFADTGLAAHLLGLESDRLLAKSTFYGPLFESFVASEIVKAQIHNGKRKDLSFFRDRQGLEVDFLVPGSGRRLILMEAKATRTVRPEAAESLSRLKKSISGYAVDSVLLHLEGDADISVPNVRPGVRSATCREIFRIIAG
jgi:predicted AAA+ superfamily ATPase